MRGDPLRGVHAFYAASAREWWAPLRPGTRTFRRNALVGVLDKPSAFAERAVHEWTGQVFRDEAGSLLSGQYRLMIRTERTKAREQKKYEAIDLRAYTDEQIDEIDAVYARRRAEVARPSVRGRGRGRRARTDGQGPVDRDGHDLLARGDGNGSLRGQAPPPRVREPATDPPVLPSRRSQRARRDAAGALDPNSRGERATPPHSTTDACGRRGSSICAPIGWATTHGSGSWTASSASSTSSATRSGSGERWRASTSPMAGARLSTSSCGPNQRGELTTPGHATILLPSQKHGPVILPDPPGGADRPSGRTGGDRSRLRRGHGGTAAMSDGSVRVGRGVGDRARRLGRPASAGPS